VLTVTFDDQIFQLQQRGGISRYAVELIRQFRVNPELGIHASTPYRRVVNDHLVDLDPTRYRHGPSRARVRHLLNGWARHEARRPDVVHHTYYDAKRIGSPYTPSVTTVHDMIPELFAGDGVRADLHAAKEAYVRAAAGVICVSETTRRDLDRLYGPIDAEVVVVHHGVGREFRDPRPTSVPLPDRFVLHVGGRGGYKDWSTLVAAWQHLDRDDDLALVCLGGGAFTPDERELLASEGLTARARQLVVADGDLPGVYAAAAALVAPSRYEGFGLPLLEAFAAGCPVVASDTACFREVADTAAAFFPVGDAAALGTVLDAVLRDGPWRARLVDDGRLRASDFTWERAAAQTADLYRSVAAP
jgi:glycosyltransferase involved in cell wall biosynthesis